MLLPLTTHHTSQIRKQHETRSKQARESEREEKEVWKEVKERQSECVSKT
jgi:hypothetical protein